MPEPAYFLSKSVTVPWALILTIGGLAGGTGLATAGGAVTREGDLSAVSARIEDVADQADRHLDDAMKTRDAKLDALIEEVRALRAEVRELRAESRGDRR